MIEDLGIKTYDRPAPIWRYLRDPEGLKLAVTYWDEAMQSMVASTGPIPANWIMVQSDASL